jgi:hypothetical protein
VESGAPTARPALVRIGSPTGRGDGTLATMTRPGFLSARLTPGNGWLFAGLALVGCYAAIAFMFDGFDLPIGVAYGYASSAAISTGVDLRLLRELHPYAIWSVIAKVAFLLPACLCFAAFASHAISADRIASVRGSLAGASDARILALVTAVTALLLLFWSQLVYQGQPVYDDEYTYLFQAQILGHGQLVAQPPAFCPECFKNQFIILKDGVWVGKYTAGHPLLLALSNLAGSPYVIPIAMSSLLPLLGFLVAREMYDRRTAILAAALFTVSPFFLFATSTLMNHGTCLFFLLAFALCYLRSERGRAWAYPIAAGLAIGVAFNIRPQCAAAFAAPFAVWSIARIAGADRGRFLLRHLAIGLAFLGPLALALIYNHAVTGEYLTFPFVEAEPGGGAAVSFLAVTDQTAHGHTLLRAIYFAVINLWRMNAYLFGWGISLLFVLVVIWRRLYVRADAPWIGVVACTAFVYLWFPSPGVLEIGPRYYFNMLLPILIWSARGMISVHDRLCASAPDPLRRPQVLVPAFVILSVAMSLCTFYREQMRHYLELSEQVARPYALVERSNIHDAIVAVRNLPPAGWVYGLRNNDPELARNDVIYVRGTDPDRLLKLLDAFPRRRMYGLVFEGTGADLRGSIVPFSREMLVAASAELAREEREGGGVGTR